MGISKAITLNLHKMNSVCSKLTWRINNKNMCTILGVTHFGNKWKEFQEVGHAVQLLNNNGLKRSRSCDAKLE